MPTRQPPPVTLEMARTVFQTGRSFLHRVLRHEPTLAEGPKVFAFDALTCEALENFDLSVSTTDYLPPFPSVVIEFPTTTPGSGSSPSRPASTRPIS